MSRNEGKIGSGDEQAVDAARILAEIGLESGRLPRPAAVACYLSASEGWREVSTQLGGAFAPPACEADD